MKNVSLVVSFLALSFLSVIQTGSAQNALWVDIPESDILASQDDRQIFPNQYRTLRLDFPQLKSILATAPDAAQVQAGNPGLELSFPLPDGRMTRYKVWYNPVMAPELAAQYPEIRSFAGIGIDLPAALIYFDISPKGLHAMTLRSGKGSVYIDPYAKGNTIDYICYFKKDFVKRTGNNFVCHVEDDVIVSAEIPVDDRAGNCGNLRSFRLALACTGEYANYHGSFGTDKAPALAAMNTSMTRINGVFTSESGIFMSIIANTTNIIYTNGATDPYTNNNGGTMLGENQTTCDNVIGSANYDIGHVFSTGGGGVAVLNSPCANGNKAKGVTGGSNPVGDPFDIDYVAHEMGHQYGAAHTQFNNCNRSNSSAMEPGSASTIMGYAGICSPNVQDNSDDYFHARSLQQIAGFVDGAGCASLSGTGNSAPVVANLTNKTIPISTPFVLSASATDPNGDALTYCWEQMNAYTNTQPMPPEPTNTSGPVFRSLIPEGNSSRYFPKYADVLNNTNDIWEVLPSVGRTMNFRVTVRDNHAGAGCTSEKDIVLTVSGGAGPFLVTQPNTNVNYPINSNQTINWNVANTAAAPVSCTNVSILLSHNGGASYTALAASTPNDGSQVVTIPGPTTNDARIMITCTNNVFYDVSNADFTISMTLPVELLNFHARYEEDLVRLNWSTASEKDNEGFHVERSTENTGDFKSIGWLSGHGSTQIEQQYSFEDRDLQRGVTYFYRLAQMNTDGSVIYSDVQAVRVEGVSGELTIAPNPAQTTIQLQLPADAGKNPLQVSMWTAAGQLVLTQTLEQGELLDVAELPEGMYVVQVIAGTQFLKGRFVKK